MISYLAEVATGNPILDNLWMQYGALGILIGLLIVVIVYQQRKNDKKDQRIDDLQESRLQDQKESAKVQNQPFEKLTEYVKTLYELSNGKKGE